MGQQSPLGENLHDALMEFSSPDENIMLAPQNQAALVKAGLVELDSDGNARMTPAGRTYVSAAETGDVRKATDAVSTGTDRATRRADLEARRAAAAAKKGGGGGGGKAPKAKPTDAEKLAQKQQAAQQLATDTAPQAGLQPADVDALRSVAQGSAQGDTTALEALGFVDATGATAAGRAALAALEKGDLVAYQAAKQRGASDKAKQDATASAPSAADKKTQQAAAAQAQHQANIDKVGAQSALGQNLHGALLEFASPDENIQLADQNVQPLVDAGMIELDTSGTPRLTTEGKAYARAADKGDVRAANDAVSKARDAAKKRADAAKLPVPTKHFPTHTTKAASTPLVVFKDASGAQRWLAITTSAYQDRDGEWITMKAMRGAVDLAERTGYRGPLRFWHVPGLDLGDCDYQAITDNGRFLIESGTFRSEAAARIGMAAAAKGYQMSPGFVHPPMEPDAGAFHHIAIFERSFVPPGRASNPYTAFHTHKEQRMLTDEKKKEFASLAADPEGMALLESLLSQAQRTDKEAQDRQAVYKEAPAWAQALVAEVATLKAAMPPQLAKAQPPAKTPQPADAGSAPEDESTELEDQLDGGQDEGQEDAEEASGDYVGDMSPTEFMGLLQSAISDALQPIIKSLDIAGKMGDHVNELKTMIGGQQQAAAAQKDDTLAQMQERISALDASLKELQGDQPHATGFRPSQSDATVVTKEAADARVPFIDSFVDQLVGQHAQQ